MVLRHPDRVEAKRFEVGDLVEAPGVQLARIALPSLRVAQVIPDAELHRAGCGISTVVQYRPSLMVATAFCSHSFQAFRQLSRDRITSIPRVIAAESANS